MKKYFSIVIFCFGLTLFACGDEDKKGEKEVIISDPGISFDKEEYSLTYDPEEGTFSGYAEYNGVGGTITTALARLIESKWLWYGGDSAEIEKESQETTIRFTFSFDVGGFYKGEEDMFRMNVESPGKDGTGLTQNFYFHLWRTCEGKGYAVLIGTVEPEKWPYFFEKDLLCEEEEEESGGDSCDSSEE